jgi:hypothetical protein
MFTSHRYEPCLHSVYETLVARRQAYIIFCSRNSHFLFPWDQQTNSMESPVAEHSLTLHTKHKHGFSKYENGTGLGNCFCSPHFQNRLCQRGSWPVIFISYFCNMLSPRLCSLWHSRYEIPSSIILCFDSLRKYVT